MVAARRGPVAKPYDVMSATRVVVLFDAESGAQIRSLWTTEKEPGDYLTASPDGRHLAAPRAFGTTVWDLATGKRRYTTTPAAGAAFSPAGELILVQHGHTVSAHDPATGNETRSFAISDDRQDRAVGPVAVSPDGSRIAYATPRGVVLVDTRTGKDMRRLSLPTPGGLNRVNDVAFSADGSRVIGCSGLYTQDDAKPDQAEPIPVDRSRTVCLWNAGSGQLLAKFDAYEKTVSAAALIDNDQSAVAASTDGTVRAWKLPAK
jgi:WD40 repeat protein